MKDRILQFLAAEKLSAAEFADKIGVQRSSISHILNGRNYPSANFIQKMLMAFPDLNSRWLLIGNGAMYMDSSSTIPEESIIKREDKNIAVEKNITNLDANGEASMDTGLFSVNISDIKEFDNSSSGISQTTGIDSFRPEDASLKQTNPLQVSVDIPNGKTTIQQGLPPKNAESIKKEIEQVLFFYDDKTFTIYRPS